MIAIFAFGLLYFEAGAANSNIKTYVDAFWTLQMSASTIGFGDHYPVTIGGRTVVALMFYVGVGLVGFIGALIAERLLGFADTNVKNRELRQQNSDILERTKILEQKIDTLTAGVEDTQNFAKRSWLMRPLKCPNICRTCSIKTSLLWVCNHCASTSNGLSQMKTIRDT